MVAVIPVRLDDRAEESVGLNSESRSTLGPASVKTALSTTFGEPWFQDAKAGFGGFVEDAADGVSMT